MHTDVIKQMKDISLFTGVSLEKLNILAAQTTYKNYKSGEMVIGETDPIKSFYVVVAGQLKLYRSSAEGKEQTLQLTISQRELAKILGATPEALSRALRKMANDGVLSTAGRTITIVDQKRLEQLAEGE